MRGTHATTRAVLATSLLFGAVAFLPALAGDQGSEGGLYDPAEAARYRRKPADLTGSILETATSQPDADRPGRFSDPGSDPGAASQPDSPFASTPQDRRDALPGYLELSDGRILPGLVWTTREKPWSVFEDSSKSFRRIPPVVVRRIDAAVVWERDEPEWRWKEAGSDVKVYTGRTYPARMTHYTFTLADGRQIAGTVQQPIYVKLDAAAPQPTTRPDGERDVPIRFILHERDKGPLGDKLSDLVYVRHVHLGRDALARGLELARRRAAVTATQPAD